MQQPLTEIINNAICDNPEILLASLGLEEEIRNDRINTRCHIHDGNNTHAMSIYFNEYYSVRGRWVCYTNNCQMLFKKSLIGMVRGILSNRHCGWSKPGDKIYGWNATLNYLKELYGIDGSFEINPADIERRKFINSCHCDQISNKNKGIIFSKEKYLKYYSSPPQYLYERDFSDEILEKYNVRYCNSPNSKLYRRCCIPVFDDTYRNVIGISARTTCDQKPKWYNTTDFPSSTNLYNYNFASKSIRHYRSVIIVESPLNVFKLEESNIHNSVCIWSATGWNDYKRYLLDKLGVMKLVLALDNDEAGLQGRQQIHESAGRFYNIVDIRIPPEFNDVADMSVEQIQQLFKGVN